VTRINWGSNFAKRERNHRSTKIWGVFNKCYIDETTTGALSKDKDQEGEQVRGGKKVGQSGGSLGTGQKKERKGGRGYCSDLQCSGKKWGHSLGKTSKKARWEGTVWGPPSCFRLRKMSGELQRFGGGCLRAIGVVRCGVHQKTMGEWNSENHLHGAIALTCFRTWKRNSEKNRLRCLEEIKAGAGSSNSPSGRRLGGGGR